MSAGARLGLAAWVLLSAGCPPRLSVALRSSSERLPQPAFVVTEPQAERPRYTNVEVSQGSAALWSLRAEPFGDTASQAVLVYGETPPGFTALTPSAALQPGVVYRLSVRGPLQGALFFEADERGAVREVPPP